MTPEAFESQLRNLDRVATLVRRRTGRETWRFEFASKPYYLHFYPQGSRLSASIAPREYAGLKTLQDFKIPAVKVVALMAGFNFGSRKGHAVITQGIEPAQPLSEAVLSPADHLSAVIQIAELLKQFIQHDLGHSDLSPDCFFWHEGRVYIKDAVDLRSEILTESQLLQFAHNSDGFCSKSDRLRIWRIIRGDAKLPVDRHKPQRYAKDLKSDAVEMIQLPGWAGRFKPENDRKLPYSVASGLKINVGDWQREWPLLVDRIKSDQLEILKRDRSGDILSAQVTLQGHPIDVVVKRPQHKYWYRHLFGVFRWSRARRLWEKTRWVLVRRLPVEYPLIVMERRVMGYAVESIAVFERVHGTPLDQFNLDTMSAGQREDFFRKCGRYLRKIEETGLSHTDAKSSNWIVHPAGDGPCPIMIDAYGMRRLTSFLQLAGIKRLLRAMKQHPAYTQEDSLHLCLGFAPRSAPEVE